VLPLVIDGKAIMPSVLTPTDQLRARALRLSEMASEFAGDPMCQRLREQAAELEAQADALERKG
jgi:hypothetical protein